MRMLLGAAAGVAATVALQRLRGVTAARLPHARPPMREEPGAFVVDRVKELLPAPLRDGVPPAAEHAAAAALALGYGAAAGALYAAVAGTDETVLRDGVLVGVAVWAVGFLGWLPASGLMPPPTAQRPAQLALPLVEHAVFGVATVASYAALRHALAA